MAPKSTVLSYVSLPERLCDRNSTNLKNQWGGILEKNPKIDKRRVSFIPVSGIGLCEKKFSALDLPWMPKVVKT